jgi:hypothetical protein
MVVASLISPFSGFSSGETMLFHLKTGLDRDDAHNSKDKDGFKANSSVDSC